MKSFLLSACLLTLISCSNSSSLGLRSSELTQDSIFARLTIKDGLVVQSRQVIVDLQFRNEDALGETIYFDQGEHFYANGTELTYYTDANQDGYYAAWIGIEESDTEVEIKMIDSEGRETLQNVPLAQKAVITNFENGDVAPELSEGIALQYAPVEMNAQANFNVGGGECQTHFDHPNDGSGGFEFTEASLESEQEANLWLPGETIYIRLQNIETTPTPVSPFKRGEIVTKGYTNLELIVP